MHDLGIMIETMAEKQQCIQPLTKTLIVKVMGVQANPMTFLFWNKQTQPVLGQR